MPNENTLEQLNRLWTELLNTYPDGVSNTSTTKYNAIRDLLSTILQVPVNEIYATGAKTRTSNLDTRFVQGNQAGRHTKVGVAFMQVDNATVDLDRLSESAVVTSRKFVDGSDNTQYDAILIFVEAHGGLLLKRVLQSGPSGHFDLLKNHFPEARLVITGRSDGLVPNTGELMGHTVSGIEGTSNLVEKFRTDAFTSCLHVDFAIAYRFVSCLLSKRFLIATGLAGSGKTKLAQAFARWLSTNDGCYQVVPVGADWTGNENVLGYPNGLDKETYISKPALDLIIHAEAHEDIPHFLILDEMNLSHVERYFADILSVIESEEVIQLYDGAARIADGKVIPSVIKLPKNIFIIGTVNVDETTYMFSPKVLDRANVIEFRMDAGELESFLGNPAKPDLSKLDGRGASFAETFVVAAKSAVTVPAEVKAAYDAEMLLLFKTLQAHGAEFGYRTVYETARFIRFYKLLRNLPINDKPWFSGAFDCVIFQKLLPKLHGSRAKLGPVLKKLWFLCVTPHKVDAETKEDQDKLIAAMLKAAEESKAEPLKDIPDGSPYPLSAEKIGRMWRLMMDNGFASFAEA